MLFSHSIESTKINPLKEKLEGDINGMLLSSLFIIPVKEGMVSHYYIISQDWFLIAQSQGSTECGLQKNLAGKNYRIDI